MAMNEEKRVNYYSAVSTNSVLDLLTVCCIRLLDSLYAATEIEEDRYTLIEQSDFCLYTF